MRPHCRVALRVTLNGRVQGIGMRPAIVRVARRLELYGFVCNTSEGVAVHIEGAEEPVGRFISELQASMPAEATLTSIRQERAAAESFDAFTIRPATDSSGQGVISTEIPPDLVLCRGCRDDILSPTNRRHDYPFTSCTDCGPRYSIIQRMPYERPQTSMALYQLCDACDREYRSTTDRRFHSQTNACSKCGPQLWACAANNQVITGGDAAIAAATKVIRDGKIVALRGLGGYQLLADATSSTAVERLRLRKGRKGKPLAVMVKDLAAAEQLAVLNQRERELLTCAAGPILVVEASGKSNVTTSVTQDLGTIGLFLPTTPLHQLLLESAARPLVCTSGNREGEPLAYDRLEAIGTLQSIADIFLEHDRPIARPIDDSVVRVMADRPVTFRLARGYAPLSLELETTRPMLAVGGHQKLSIAVSNGSQAVLGPHIGDMDTLAGRERFVEQVNSLIELYGLRNFELVCDLHPAYFTTEWCERQPNPCVQVQHHHAHIAAGMLEQGWLDQQVLGVAFDGTGYGTDGTIWGGEFLLCTTNRFERIGHLRPFALPGGDRAVSEPWRVATSLVRDALGDLQAGSLRFDSSDDVPLLTLLARPNLSPITTSAGRLFDGVAALVLRIERCDYEGQAAIALEAACDEAATGMYQLEVTPTHPKIVDWRPMIRQLMQDRVSGVPAPTMAMRFHRGLAMAIARVCREYPALPVVFGGGVFQNRILLELLAEQLPTDKLGLPGRIPVGDGGLAAGQLVIAASLAPAGRDGQSLFSR